MNTSEPPASRCAGTMRPLASRSSGQPAGASGRELNNRVQVVREDPHRRSGGRTAARFARARTGSQARRHTARGSGGARPDYSLQAHRNPQRRAAEIRTRIGAMNRSGGGPPPLTVENGRRAAAPPWFMGSPDLRDSDAHWGHEPRGSRLERGASLRPVHRPGAHLRAEQCSALRQRFMESGNLQRLDAHWDHEPSKAPLSPALSPLPTTGRGWPTCRAVAKRRRRGRERGGSWEAGPPKFGRALGP